MKKRVRLLNHYANISIMDILSTLLVGTLVMKAIFCVEQGPKHFLEWRRLKGVGIAFIITSEFTLVYKVVSSLTLFLLASLMYITFSFLFTAFFK